jgi:hypothetical protein
MSAAPEPVESAAVAGAPEISEAAQIARERLHREIERVRNGVEEMLDDQEARDNVAPESDRLDQSPGTQAQSAGVHTPVSPGLYAPPSEDLRHELESLRIETRNYVKKKVRKSEKKLERSVREIDARTDALERRIDQVEADREEAEWRIHNSTEEMLDGLLDDIRSIADRLADQPAPKPEKAKPEPAKASPPAQAPVGRVGPRPLGIRNK